ncbi:hypothetical protein AB1E18_018091 [Capra hircus]
MVIRQAPYREQNDEPPTLAMSALSCACVEVVPLDAASPALQQAGQLTQVSGGVLNGGLLLPLEEPSGTQGMQELSLWHLPEMMQMNTFQCPQESWLMVKDILGGL